MKKSVVAAVLAAVLLVSCSGSRQAGQEPGVGARILANLKARFTDGNQELQKAFEAKKQAKSWRMKTIMRSHPGSALVTETEVSCPDRVRMTASIGGAQYETIRVGSEGYLRTDQEGWRKAAIRDDFYPCGSQPGQPAPWAMMSEGRDILTAMAMIAKNGTVTRGYLVNSDTGRCQEWVLSLSHPGSRGQGRSMTYTICIGDDQLPREVYMGSGMMRVSYSDWNQPINISEPPNAAQIPEVQPDPTQATANPHAMGMPTMPGNPHSGIAGAPQPAQPGMKKQGGQKPAWVKQ